MKPAASRHLFLRADADSTIGNGHFMRSLALAMEWTRQGGNARMVTCCADEALLDRARSAGVAITSLDGDARDARDASAVLPLLSEAHDRSGSRPWLVIDGYHFTHELHGAVRAAGFPVLVIDDTAHLPQYHATLLLNQNLSADRSKYVADPDTRFMMGPSHALLQPAFRSARPARQASECRRLVVTMGGADHPGVTDTCLDALGVLNDVSLEAVVVVGSTNVRRAHLQQRVADMQALPVSTAVDVQDMAALFASADLLLTAAGSTCWEAAALGLPALLVVTADNQRENAALLDEAGAATRLGWHADITAGDIAGAIRELRDDAERRAAMATRSRELVDGRGAERVVAAMLTLNRRSQE